MACVLCWSGWAPGGILWACSLAHFLLDSRVGRCRSSNIWSTLGVWRYQCSTHLAAHRVTFSSVLTLTEGPREGLHVFPGLVWLGLCWLPLWSFRQRSWNFFWWNPGFYLPCWWCLKCALSISGDQWCKHLYPWVNSTLGVWRYQCSTHLAELK